MKNKYEWDLSAIFSSDEQFESSLKEIKKRIDKFSLYQNQSFDNGANLYQIMDERYSIGRELDKLIVYSELMSDANLNNDKYSGYKSQIDNLKGIFKNAYAFIGKLILSISDEQLERLYKTDPRLLQFQQAIYNIQYFREHTPSLEQKEYVSLQERLQSKTFDTYKCINNDLIYSQVTIDGKKVKVNQGNFLKYRLNDKRAIRKKVFGAYHNSLANYNKIYSSNYETRVIVTNAIAKLKNFSHPLEDKLFEDGIPFNAFEQLIETVASTIPLKSKYNKIVKRYLKVKELHQYDLNYNLNVANHKKYPYDDALDEMIKAFSIYGEDYLEKLKDVFYENSIDAFPRDNKSGFSYHMRNYEKPYILYNYRERLEDVFTIAHEAGHAVNALKVKEKQDYQNFYASILLSEIASLTNEVILADYYLNSSNSIDEKLIILKRIIDLFMINVYENIKRAEFEQAIYNKSLNDESLTSTNINDTYLEYIKKYAGDNVKIDDCTKFGWVNIVHLYYFTFYNYQYAIGLLVAVKTIHNIKKDKKYLDNYIHFLEIGGSMTTMEAFNVLGIDITNPDYIKDALSYLSQTIDEYGKLLREKEN